METAEYDYTHFESGHQNEADKGLLVKFYLNSVQDREASLVEGKPIFKDVEYIDTRAPGSRDNIARRASIEDKSRFPAHYAAFKNRMETPEEGTPLVEWNAISRSLAEQLSFENIKTVEQLAELNDSLMHNVKNGQGLKQRAKDWLAYTKDESILFKLRAEIEEREKTISDLSARLDAIEAAQTEAKTTKVKEK